MPVSTMKTFQLLRFILPVLGLAMLPSCNCAFREAWNEPTSCAFMLPKAPDVAKISQVAGKWEGTWLSEASGHHGKLRCIVSLPHHTLVSADYHLDHKFFYHATWKSILSGSYSALHQVVEKKDGTYVFKGEHKMPDWAGGLYHYEGTIKGDEFKANYRCAMDHGTYTMKRAQ